MFRQIPIQDPVIRDYCIESTRKSIERMISTSKLERKNIVDHSWVSYYLGLLSISVAAFYFYKRIK